MTKGRGKKVSASEVTRDLFRRLRNRYPDCVQQRDVLLEEVGDGAGLGNRGWSDAIAMSVWPSKGLVVTGFEVKASRPDWLKELDSPEKNRTWQESCHEWYVVAPKEIVDPSELETGWGLMCPVGEDGLRIKSRATRREHPKQVTYDLLAAVFRSAANDRKKYKRHVGDELREEAYEEVRDDTKRLLADRDNYERKYRELKALLGNEWASHEEISKRAQAARSLKDNDILKELGSQERAVEAALSRLRKVRESYEAEISSVGGWG